MQFDFGTFVFIAFCGYLAGMGATVGSAFIRLLTRDRGDLFGFNLGALLALAFYASYIWRVQVPKILIACGCAFASLRYYGDGENALPATCLACAVIAAVCLSWMVRIEKSK